MTTATRWTHAACLAVALELLCVPPAHAYLDGGSASLLFQAVVAVVLSGFLAVKIFWRNRLGRLRSLFSAREGDDHVGT